MQKCYKINELIRKYNKIINNKIDLMSIIALSKNEKFNDEWYCKNANNSINLIEYNKFISFINRYEKNEPIQYILNEQFFWKSLFYVNRDVLIPRFDSEILIEYGSMLFNSNKLLNILDLGIGSGCLLYSLLQEYNKSIGFGIEISINALKVALYNGYKLDLQDRFHLMNRSFENTNISLFPSKFDIIISNPPYIRTDEYNTLSSQVKDYEPKIALNPGKTGMESYYQIFKILPNLLKQNGYCILEIGYNQKDDILKLINLFKYKLIKLEYDYGNCPRMVILKV